MYTEKIQDKETIRFEELDKKDPDYKAKLKQQLKDFETEAKKGKVICLSDLMGNAGM